MARSYYEVFETGGVSDVGGYGNNGGDDGASSVVSWGPWDCSDGENYYRGRHEPWWNSSSWSGWESYSGSYGHGGRRHYANWSWDGGSEDGRSSRSTMGRWMWVAHDDRDEPGHGGRNAESRTHHSHRVDSPPPTGFDRHGNWPSGDCSAAGDRQETQQAGGDLGDGERRGRGKPSSSYPPIFKAKQGESYHDWKRSVSFWLGGEGNSIPVEYIGPRIMVQLRDRAAQLVKHLTMDDVKGPRGMETIFQTLERTPLVKQLDRHRVDQCRKKLMMLSRFAGESLESYITRGSIYRNQLLGLDSSLAMGEKFYVGHLLDHARLTRRDRALVKTRAGEETEDNVVTALTELAAELEGESGYPIGISEPNMANQNGEEFLVQRSTTYRRGGNGGGRAALVNTLESVADEMEEDRTASLAGDAGDESYDEDVPLEVIDAEKEAYAMQYKAKQRMAEARKMRQYYRKDPEERKKALAEKMKNTHCHNCGELGHWSRECPKSKASPIYGANYATSCGMEMEENDLGKGKCHPTDSEWDLLVSLCTGQGPCAESSDCQAYMVLPSVDRVITEGCSSVEVLEHGNDSKEGNKVEVLWCIRELAGAVILDLGCLKSVAGTKWVNNIISRWRQQGWWFRIDKANETFRFGSGSTLDSHFSIQFVATFAGKLVILSFSVVKGDCPPLFSRPACSQLGAVFDCGRHTLSSTKLGVKSYGMSQTASGHYIMNIDEFDKVECIPDIPTDYSMGIGKEVVIWQVESFAAETFGLGNPPQDIAQVSDVEGGSSSPGMSCVRRSRASRERMSSVDDRRGGELRHSQRRDHEHGRSLSPRGDPCDEGHGRVGEPLSQWVLPTFDSSGIGSGGGGNATQECSQGEGMGLWFDKISDSAGDLPHGGRLRDHRGGETDLGQAQREDEGNCREAKAVQGLDGQPGQLPVTVPHMEQGRGPQHRRKCASSDGGLRMEEVSVDAEGEDCGGAHFSRCHMEAQSALAGELARHRDGQPLRALRIDETATTKPGDANVDVSSGVGADDYVERPNVVFENHNVSEGDGFSKYDKISTYDEVSQNVQLSETNAVSDFENVLEEQAVFQNVKATAYDKVFVEVGASEYNLDVEDLGKDAGGGEKEWRRRPQRGLTQKMKKGVAAGLLAMALVQATGMMRTSYTVMEIFAGKAMMTQVAATREGWMAYEPVDILLGGTEHDMLQKSNAKKLKEVVRNQKPDVLVITPPCGPWSLWQNQRLDFDALEALRQEHLPFWQLTRDLWELQDSEGRWVMTEQPATSEALDLSYMRERSNLHRVILDQCMFGLKDPISHKAYRKTTALDVNDERWAKELANCRRCNHQPHQHEQVKGSVKFEGTWQRRSTLAGAWTKPWCQHILKAFEKAQATNEEVPMNYTRAPTTSPTLM